MPQNFFTITTKKFQLNQFFHAKIERGQSVYVNTDILLGGIGGLAPSRRSEVASLGLRAILAGSLTTFMTACVAGFLV